MPERDIASREQLDELGSVGGGGLAMEADGSDHNEMPTSTKHGGYRGGETAFQQNGPIRRETMEQEPISFWGTVNLAEEIVLPKPHLTQPDVTTKIEEAMASLDERGRVSAFRQVLVGVAEGRFSQFALLPFGHNAWTTNRDDDGNETRDKSGELQKHNRMGETRRMLAVMDAIVAEMPDDAEPKKHYAAYGRVVDELRDDSGSTNDDRLVDLIREADEAGQPFWVDSRDFIFEGQIKDSKISLADLVKARVLSVSATERGGTKIFVANRKDIPGAIDALASSGFTSAADVLRERTRERPRNIGSSLSSLVGLSSQSSSEDEDADEEESA